MSIISGREGRGRVCRGLVVAGVMGLVGPGVSAQVPVYANQTNGGQFAISFIPALEFWDDLQLTQGGTLTSLSLIGDKSGSSGVPEQASGRIDLTFFDEANNFPQGELIGSIFFNGTFDPVPNDPNGILLKFDGLETTPFVLPGAGRLGIGVEFDSSDWGVVDYGPPIIGASPGGGWVGTSHTEFGGIGADLGWKVLVTGTTTQAVWTQGAGDWDTGFFWDIDRAPDATQDVLLRSYGIFRFPSVITGPGANTTIDQLTIGESSDWPIDLQLQPGVELTTGNTQLGEGSMLTINGGTLRTQSLSITAGAMPFDAGTVQVTGGFFGATAAEYVLSGTGGPTLILDDADISIIVVGGNQSIVIGQDNADSGTMIVRNGGGVDVKSITVGQSDQSTGQFTASGAGTVVDAREQLILGENTGTVGNLLVEDQAVVNAVILTVGAGGSGHAVVDGGTLNVLGDLITDGELLVGGEVPGSLTIRNSGQVNTETVKIGATPNQVGASALITGPGSTLNSMFTIFVGEKSSASLRVEQGASIIGSNLVADLPETLSPGDLTTIEIDGDGTTVELTGTLLSRQQSQLTVSNGASVSADTLWVFGGDIRILGTGSTVDTSASTTSTANAIVEGGGSILLEDGAQVLSKGLMIGGFAGEGVVQIMDLGTHWTATDVFVVVGSTNNGTLEVSGGATFSQTGDVFVVGSDGPEGVIDLFDPGTQMTLTGTLFLSGGRANDQVFDFTSIGTVRVRDGASLVVNGSIEPFTNGTVFLQSGASIRATTIDLSSGGNFEFQGGVLSVDTFVGTLTQDGGTLAPGSSAGTTSITGDFVMNAGTFAVEIGGLVPGTEFDQLLVGNTATINPGAALDVSLINPFTPILGDSFLILNAGGTLTGTFDSVLFSTIPGVGLGVLYDATTVTLLAGLIGDLDADGFVGITDLNIVLSNWNQNVNAGVWLLGDTSGDGFVGIEDLNVVLGNWNNGTPPGVEVSGTVPEPATLALIGLGGLAMLRHR